MKKLLLLLLLPFTAQAVEVRPWIQGTFTDGGGGPGTGCWVANGCSINIYQGHIAIDNQTYVYVSGPYITESVGRGIAAQNSIGIKYEYLKVDHTAGASIYMSRSGNTIMRNSESSRGGLCYDGRHGQRYTECSRSAGAGNRPVVVSMNRNWEVNSPGGLIENMFSHSQYGEGIACWRSTNCIVRGNRVADTWSTSFYSESCKDCVYENNILTPLILPKSAANGFERDGSIKLGVSSECYPGGTNCTQSNGGTGVILRNNMLITPADCFTASRISGQQASTEPTTQVGLKAYGNTCWNPQQRWLHATTSDEVTEYDIQGNLFVGQTINPSCDVGTAAGRVMKYNAWESNPGGNCSNTEGGYYDTSYIKDRNALLNSYVSGLVTFVDNGLTGTNLSNAAQDPRGVDRGNPAHDTTPCLDIQAYPNWSDIEWGADWITEENWEACLAVDFNGTPRSDTPDIGAVEYMGQAEQMTPGHWLALNCLNLQRTDISECENSYLSSDATGFLYIIEWNDLEGGSDNDWTNWNKLQTTLTTAATNGKKVVFQMFWTKFEDYSSCLTSSPTVNCNPRSPAFMWNNCATYGGNKEQYSNVQCSSYVGNNNNNLYLYKNSQGFRDQFYEFMVKMNTEFGSNSTFEGIFLPETTQGPGVPGGWTNAGHVEGLIEMGAYAREAMPTKAIYYMTNFLPFENTYFNEDQVAFMEYMIDNYGIGISWPDTRVCNKATEMAENQAHVKNNYAKSLIAAPQQQSPNYGQRASFISCLSSGTFSAMWDAIKADVSPGVMIWTPYIPPEAYTNGWVDNVSNLLTLITNDTYFD